MTFPAVAALLAVVGAVREEVAPLDLRAFEQRAGALFSPAALTADGSTLLSTCDQILLITQALAATIIIAGLLYRLRKEDAPFDGIATMMLKVAFIATVPFWRTFTLETADAIAGAVGYKAIAAGGTSSPVVSRTWDLLAQWVPPGSPYLDVLESQSGTGLPPTGEETAWGVRAWNWARGVGVANEGQFQWMWQSFSGGLRASLVFICCAGTVAAVSLTLVLTYFSELLRVLLFHVGCAFVPIFVAGLGVTALRAQSTRFLLTVAAVAFWPVGWATANIVSQALLDGTLGWLRDVAAGALQAGPGLDPAPLAVAAPFLGWGTLLLFASLTLGLCLWLAGTVFLVPVLLSRAVGAGTVVLSSGASTVSSRVSIEPAPARVEMARPVAVTTLERPNPPKSPEVARSVAAPPVCPAHHRSEPGFPIMGFRCPSSDARPRSVDAANNFKSPIVR